MYFKSIAQNIFRATVHTVVTNSESKLAQSLFLILTDEQNILCRCVQFNLCFNEQNNDLALFSCRIMCDKPNNSEAWL